MIKQHIKLTTDAVVFCVINEQLMVLLVKRGNEPFKGMWALPGGFVEDDEDLIDGIKRELHDAGPALIERQAAGGNRAQNKKCQTAQDLWHSRS